jgi:hypothetical protein
MYLADDLEVLKQLERPNQFDLAVETTNYLMGKLGHEVAAPKEPRYDRTRRVLTKKRLAGRPRGVKRKDYLAAQDQGKSLETIVAGATDAPAEA